MRFRNHVQQAMVLLLLWIVIGAVIASVLLYFPSPARAEDVGDTYIVTKRFLCAMREDVIMELAVAINEKDSTELSALVNAKKVGGVPDGTSLKVVAIRGHKKVPYVVCEALREDGSVQHKVYVFKLYFDPRAKHLKKE